MNSQVAAEEDELAAILEGIGEGFYAVDHDWRIRRFNSEAARHFNRTPEEVLGRGLWEVFPDALNTPLGQLFVATMQNRESVKSETPSVVIFGRWLSYRLFPLGDGLGVVFRDITDRKSAEEQRDLLIGELHHRVSNILATVRAIAAQTLKHSNGQEALNTFEARLLNLGQAHSALTQENWASADLRQLVLVTLKPFEGIDGERFRIAGPDLNIAQKSAVALSMAIHELSTNAAKYGALSVPNGRIDIAWTANEGKLDLYWREFNGPPVQSPKRKGFGSRMIERVLAAQLNGAVSLDFEVTGLACHIEAPLDALIETNASQPAPNLKS